MQSQENRVLISGEIKNDSVPIQNVHIINKSAQKGTITNRIGQFKISVTDKDTLMISDIQFQNKIIIINQDHLLTKFIEINLLELTNELDEVIVQQFDDMSEELGLPNAGKEPLNKLDRNLNHYSQKSTPVVILEALLFKQGGIDDIYNIVSGNRKRDRKLKQLIQEDELNVSKMEYVKTIRAHFQDEFFINSVKIEEEYIDTYIYYCLAQDIGNLYDKGRLIEVIDVLLKSKEQYFQSLETVDE
ncbi:carboxypeptidase-like regulatory domain-containing protein [Lutimonas halocynthiae]|uniref:carboxypeptidase-like regulatory domain-containing protein n=1 Tax=Lutimonas halocynthiae TaxID=1446477 RepID=UPI0025B35B55|nr:carboxypeptidase-like regulatory domain-containing protein [Lutimonas halocynthiae]MDN3643418.1 carboxypeptidase-like regulatory domain-containing protein [Lutimonas halocynthiae]